MKIGQYIGIDFGTTNTAVVCVQDDEFGRKVTLLGEEGEYPFSSIVAIPKAGGSLLFGRNVRKKRIELAQTHEVHTSMKSYLGKRETSGERVSFVVGEHRYYPQDIVTAFFMHIKEYVKNHHNIDIDAASLSFPVDFSPEARRELHDAAVKAGIEVKTLTSESTSAYIANRKEGISFSKVMVLDWGGGTLDISILKLTGTSIHEVAVWGYAIGGDDIDLELAQRLHSRIAMESGIAGGRFEDMLPAERDQLIMRCEEAKIAISDDGEDYPLTIRDYGAYGTKNITITVEQFNKILEPVIKMHVLRAIDKALGKAGGLTPASIDGIIIVGGSSNLCAYERAITNLFQDAKIILPDKSQWATATGTALMQIAKGAFKLSDSVGVRLSDDTIFPILHRGIAIGEKAAPVTFSLTEDAIDAHFIFTDEMGVSVYAKKNVPTKGFLKETLELAAVISDDQIARIDISNKNFGAGANRVTTVELNKLNFYYDIGALDGLD